MAQKIIIVSNVDETKLYVDHLFYYRLPGRRFVETVAYNALSSKGCKQSNLIKRALLNLEDDVKDITKVTTIEPPHNSMQVGQRPSSPFLTALPFIEQSSIQNVEQKPNLLDYPATTSLPSDGGSLLIVADLESIWGDNTTPSSNSLLQQINQLNYVLPKSVFYPQEGISLYMYDVITQEITFWQRDGKEYVLSSQQPTHP